MDFKRQVSHGDNSPNINVDGDFLLTLVQKRPAGKEVKAILDVIFNLTAKAALDKTPIEDASYRKKLQEKLDKFPVYAARLRFDYASLVGLYGQPYDTAWENSGTDELTRKMIAVYLQGRSIILLEACGDNAIKAVEQLCKEIEESINDGVDFDANAIRFFIYRQFIECNVFPLIESEAG